MHEGSRTHQEDHETKEDAEKLEAESRSCFNPVRKTFSLARQRCTDLKANKKVHLPRALDARTEARLDVRMSKMREIFNQYKESECKGGNKQMSNLTKSQEQGLRKLRKRIQNEELIVCPTDKSGNMAITSREAYLRMGDDHVRKDMEIGDAECDRIQAELNGHVSWGT